MKAKTTLCSLVLAIMPMVSGGEDKIAPKDVPNINNQSMLFMTPMPQYIGFGVDRDKDGVEDLRVYRKIIQANQEPVYFVLSEVVAVFDDRNRNGNYEKEERFEVDYNKPSVKIMPMRY